ncbi:MAG: hypothetical protein ACK6DC_02855 [Planctomycetota bacterium]|jgi:hypothetical protein
MYCEHLIDPEDNCVAKVASIIFSLFGIVRARAWKSPREWIDLLQTENSENLARKLDANAWIMSSDETAKFISRELCAFYAIDSPQLLSDLMRLSVRHCDFPLYVFPDESSSLGILKVLQQADRLQMSDLHWPETNTTSNNRWLVGWNTESDDYLSIAFNCPCITTYSAYFNRLGDVGHLIVARQD